MVILVPRPDVGGILIFLFVFALVYNMSASPALSLALATISSIIAVPLILTIRSLILFKGEVGVKDAEKVYKWLETVVHEVKSKEAIVLVYPVRSTAGLQLVQLGHVLSSSKPPIYLLHYAAWYGEPCAAKSKSVIYVIFPTSVLLRFAEKIKRELKGFVMYADTLSDVKIVYKLVRNLVETTLNVKRPIAAYMSSKIFVKLMLKGSIRVDDSIIEKVKLPFEPPWISVKVRKQLAQETAIEP